MKIFGLNLDPVTELQLNDKSIYESKVHVLLTKFKPTLNQYKSAIDINYLLKLGIFGLSIGSLSTGDRNGIYFENCLPSG